MNEAISKERLLSKDLYLNRFLKKEKKVKKEPNIDDPKLIELRELIKNIDYTDISFIDGEIYGSEKFYSVVIDDKDINDLLSYSKNYAKRFRIGGETVSPNKFGITISITKTDFNRVHFHKPLPNILRGVGLGYKIYKALAFKLGFLSSDNTASFAAQSVWYYLIQDPDFNHILCKNFVFLIKRDLSIDDKINIVKSYMKQYNWLFDDEFDIDDQLVEELKEYGNT